MRFGDESELFGKEKDDSFQGSIGNIYQSFAGQDIYPTLEEKAVKITAFSMETKELRQQCFFTFWIRMECCLWMDRN